MLFSDCLCFTFGKISRKLSKKYREKIESFGITQPQFFLLIALYEEDKILISRLSEKVSIDKATLTGIIDRLGRDGFIKRIYSQDDRRSIYIKLTQKAEKIKSELLQIYNETNRKYLSKLSKEELKTLQNIIYKLEQID
jgi:DNA-binding MarR family transcriptional regulator